MEILIINVKSPLCKWHSDPRPETVTFQLIRLFTKFETLIPSLTFTELRVVSMEQLHGMACQQGIPTLPDNWFRPFFLIFLCILSRLCLMSFTSAFWFVSDSTRRNVWQSYRQVKYPILSTNRLFVRVSHILRISDILHTYLIQSRRERLNRFRRHVKRVYIFVII